MIILKTFDGQQHELKAGDRLVIYSDQRTVAFVSASGNPLLHAKGTDSKIIIPAFANVLGPHELAAFIATLAGLNFTREGMDGNTIHRYVFENLS